MSRLTSLKSLRLCRVIIVVLTLGNLPIIAQQPFTGYSFPESGYATSSLALSGGTLYGATHSFSSQEFSGSAPGSWPAAQIEHFDGPPASFTDVVHIDSQLTEPLLDFQNRQSDKELLLLVPPPSGMASPSVTLGGQMRISAMAATVSRRDKFSYLGRFPPDFVGKSATDVRITQANAASVIHFAPWAHGYVETLFSDVFTFPDFKQGSFQVRQAYVTFGDITQSPLYAFIGKKTVSFGDMGTLSPFSQSMVWHYFAPLAEGAGIGYASNGFNGSVTALNGSRGIRVADSAERGQINNFAANARYEFPIADDSWIAFGGGYLHGTIYDAAIAEHTNPAISGESNGAWDVNVASKVGSWRAEYEFTSTLNPWPATSSRVLAYRTEMAYDTTWMNNPLRVSGSWSEGRQGPGGAQFEFNQQFVAGLRYDPHPNVMISLEYIRSMGFAPLINITTVSDREASQDTILLGIVLNI